MLACTSLPMATTTRSKSGIESCRSVSSLVESAATTCVKRPPWAWTMSSRSSIPSTSVPLSMSSCARAVPNRPSPMTATELDSVHTAVSAPLNLWNFATIGLPPAWSDVVTLRPVAPAVGQMPKKISASSKHPVAARVTLWR